MADSTDIKSSVSELSVVPPTNRERARSRWITVEPVIALGMMSSTCISLVRPFYIKEVIQHSYNFNESNSTNKCSGAHSNNSLDDTIQSEASMWLLYLGVASGFPAMLSATIFSAMSDRLGRKMAMTLPAIGFSIQAAVYCLVVQFQLPLPVLFAGEILQGLTGGFNLLFAGCISYLTDATSANQRTVRIVIAEMLTFLVGGLNEVGEGYLIKVGYLPPLAIALGCDVITLLYITIPPFLIETINRNSSYHKEFREVGRSIKRLLEFNEKGRRWQMLLLDFFIFFCFSQFIGVSAILVLYGTAEPFCWSSSTAGIAMALVSMSTSLGMLFGTKVFSLCLGDYWLMQICCLSVGISYLVVGLAQSTWVIFVGIALGCLKGIGIPVARSVLSKITHPDETGAMFSIVACLESFSTFASSLLSTSLYAATVSFLPPLTFYVYSGATLIPVGITLALQIYWQRKKEYIPLNAVDNAE